MILNTLVNLIRRYTELQDFQEKFDHPGKYRAGHKELSLAVMYDQCVVLAKWKYNGADCVEAREKFSKILQDEMEEIEIKIAAEVKRLYLKKNSSDNSAILSDE